MARENTALSLPNEDWTLILYALDSDLATAREARETTPSQNVRSRAYEVEKALGVLRARIARTVFGEDD